MKRRRWRRSNETPPVGEARRSQLLTTYGAGSMIDLVDRSILVAGLDFWNYPGDRPVIHEPRLAARLIAKFRAAGRTLSTAATFSPPPQCDEREPSERAGLQVVEFPRSMVCQACRQLVQASSSLKIVDGRYHHACAPRGDVLVPVRFVVMCGNGHLEEFPWSSFVHDGAPSCTSSALTVTEDAGAELVDVRLTCLACNATRTMDQAEPFVKATSCRGFRPWLGSQRDVAEKSCESKVTMKVRTSSSTYFGVTQSALSIPNAADRLQGLVEKHRQMLEGLDSVEDLTGLLKFKGPVKTDLGGYPVHQVWAVLDAVRRGEPAPTLPLKEAEYEYVQGVPLERPGDAPTDEERAASFFARRLEPKRTRPAGIERVVLVRQLREVFAQVGFSRLAPIDAEMDGDVKVDIAQLGHMTDWLPAIENRGEGLWLQLDEVRLAAWEKHAVVQHRADALRAGWNREFADRTGPAFFGARYYLLHRSRTS